MEQDTQQSLPLSPKKEKIIRRVLDARESFILTLYVEKHYAESACTDEAFAKKAEAATLIPGLTRHHIKTCREIRDIPSYLDVVRAEKMETTKMKSPRLNLFDKRITSLEAQVRKLFAGYNVERAPTDEDILRLWNKVHEEIAFGNSLERVIAYTRALLRGDWK